MTYRQDTLNSFLRWPLREARWYDGLPLRAKFTAQIYGPYPQRILIFVVVLAIVDLPSRNLDRDVFIIFVMVRLL